MDFDRQTGYKVYFAVFWIGVSKFFLFMVLLAVGWLGFVSVGIKVSQFYVGFRGAVVLFWGLGWVVVLVDVVSVWGSRVWWVGGEVVLRFRELLFWVGGRGGFGSRRCGLGVEAFVARFSWFCRVSERFFSRLLAQIREVFLENGLDVVVNVVLVI